MKEVIKMPNEVKQVIVRALKHYQNSISKSIDAMIAHGGENVNVDPLNWEYFDTMGLIGIFNEKDAELDISIDKDALETFVSRHNVDFPLWEGVED